MRRYGVVAIRRAVSARLLLAESAEAVRAVFREVQEALQAGT